MFQHRCRLRAFVHALLVIAVLGSAMALPARGDTQGDYEKAKRELARLSAESELLVDEYNGEAVKQDELATAIREQTIRTDKLKSDVADKKVRVREQAAHIYKYGATQAVAGLRVLSLLAGREGLSKLAGYLASVHDRTRAVLTSYEAAKTDLESDLARLQQAVKDHQRVMARLESRQRDIEASVIHQEAITTRFRDQLNAERQGESEAARRRAEGSSQLVAAGNSVTTTPAPSGGSGGSRGSGATGPAPATTSGGSGGPGGSATTTTGAATTTTSPKPEMKPPPSPAPGAATAVAFAKAQVGKPYCWGGTGPDCYDCSGLTGAAWSAGGRSIPRTSSAQAASLPEVPMSQVRPGDLVWRPGHISIYVGGGAVVTAPQTGDTVRYATLGNYQKAVRP